MARAHRHVDHANVRGTGVYRSPRLGQYHVEEALAPVCVGDIESAS